MQQRKPDESPHTFHEWNFGTYLKVLRDRHGIKQGEVVAKLPTTWTQPMYSDIERGRTSPSFDDLESIYQALHRAGVQLTLQDRKQFLALAQAKLEAKRTHRVQKPTEVWDELRRKLVRIDHLPDNDEVFPFIRESVKRHVPPTNIVRREIDHLLGRETWLDSLVGTIKNGPVKVLVVQGPPGSGKTSEIHRLASRFLQSIPRYSVVLSELSPIDLERLEPDIALELLLGDILEVVGSPYTSMPMTNLQARMRYVIECLARAGQPVVIFLDNAEQTLDNQGDLTPTWRQFLTKFAQASHRTSLILATQEWPSSFLAETQLIMNTEVSPLSQAEGSALLQRLGLGDIREEQLGLVVEAVGGVPLCLEWVARLAQEPLLHDDWADFEEVVNSEALLTRVLEEAALFSGPIAKRVQPLLDRVIKRLSAETGTVLEELALSPVPLGAPALKVLYHHPTPLKELRDASLLVAYHKRVQLLPMVAAQVRKGLTDSQVHAAEERLIVALKHWLERGVATIHEQGQIFTELACLLLRRHRLLAAAELILYHGWLSSHVGQMLRLAHSVQQIFDARPWSLGDALETELETESGGLLLHYYLASYLGEEIDDHARAEAYERILAYVSASQVSVEPLMQVYLLDHIMRDYTTAERFEEALFLFETCFLRLEPLLASDMELHATLLSQQAALYNRWSGSAKSNGRLEEAQRMQEQTIAIYQSCLTLLEEALQKAKEGTLWQSTLRKKQATFLNNLAYHFNTVGCYEEALKVVNACIDLKEQGYAERDSLAASSGEKSQILAALGQFQEALRLDELACEEIRRCAEAGDTLAQEEQWIYQVNQGRLYLLLGRIDEATRLLQEAEPKMQPRRRIFQNMAQDALLEIKQGRAQSAPAPFQLDWRWVKRYRALSAYDAYWWWAHAGPFTAEEQEHWDRLFIPPIDEETKNPLRKLLLGSRDRELEVALAEHREPRLHYCPLTR
jgi:transcriptional regulator with XRE-family HTH domain/tetratricopeptide (TPR) repeat protein